MFIPVSVGSVRTAIAAAVAATNETIAADRATISERSYNQLYNGAVHNGLKPSEADLAKMREMSDRDVDHMMSDHPAKPVLERLNTMNEMLAFSGSDKDDAIIDHDEFSVLKKHLTPPGNEADEATTKE